MNKESTQWRHNWLPVWHYMNSHSVGNEAPYNACFVAWNFKTRQRRSLQEMFAATGCLDSSLR